MTSIRLVRYNGAEPIIVGGLSDATYEFSSDDRLRRVSADDAILLGELPDFEVLPDQDDQGARKVEGETQS